LAKHEVQEEFSEKGQKPKEARPLREVNIAKNYPAISRYFSWQIANNYSFLLYTM